MSPRPYTLLLRLLALGVVGLLSVVIAAWAPSRLEVSVGPNPPELAGVYILERYTRGGATNPISFLRLSETGDAGFESVRVRDDGGVLTVSAGSMRVFGRWYLERPAGPAALLWPARLCVKRGDHVVTCSRVERDAVTGDLAWGDRKLFGRWRPQRLTKLRAESLAY